MTRDTYERHALRVLVALVAALLIGSVAAAGAPPSPPHQFYGSVTDQNGNAVAGATVQFSYDGAVIGTATTDGSGSYQLKVEDPAEGVSGETVTVAVGSERKTATWESAGTTELDFSVADSGGDDPTTEDESDSPPSGGGDAPASGGGQSGNRQSTTANPTPSTGTPDTPTTTTAITAGTSEAPESTTEPTVGSTATVTSTTNDGGQPGFGLAAAVVALVAAALLIVRRKH